jgi:hypothetical protein
MTGKAPVVGVDMAHRVAVAELRVAAVEEIGRAREHTAGLPGRDVCRILWRVAVS